MAQEHFDRAYTVTTNEETKTLYDEWATTYDDDLTGGGYAQPARVAEEFIRLGVDKSATILDIGCGTGLSGLALAQAGYETLDGCDYSTGMLEVAHETSAYRRLFEADLHKPPIDADTDSYDAVAVVGVFGFAHVQPVALTEMLRPLRSGGSLVIGVNGGYYDSGLLSDELERLETAGVIGSVSAELGDHIPGRGVPGWVVSMSKR
ncbi:MAG: class I SAM-dependent methyltransferase [Acidimicrobiia bacterium]|nr:class I SAM-dependent methyltransferase [Acidimicrobiia bacterium]